MQTKLIEPMQWDDYDYRGIVHTLSDFCKSNTFPLIKYIYNNDIMGVIAANVIANVKDTSCIPILRQLIEETEYKGDAYWMRLLALVKFGDELGIELLITSLVGKEENKKNKIHGFKISYGHLY